MKKRQTFSHAVYIALVGRRRWLKQVLRQDSQDSQERWEERRRGNFHEAPVWL